MTNQYTIKTEIIMRFDHHLINSYTISFKLCEVTVIKYLYIETWSKFPKLNKY